MLELPCASLFESFGDECHLGVKPFVYLESHSSVNAVARMKGLLGMRMKFCKGRRRRVFSLTNIIQIYDERITVFNPTKTAVSNSSTTLCQTA